MADKIAIVTEFLGSLRSDSTVPPRTDLLADDLTYTSSRGTVTGRDAAMKYLAGPTAFTFYQKGDWSKPRVDGEVIEVLAVPEVVELLRAGAHERHNRLVGELRVQHADALRALHGTSSGGSSISSRVGARWQRLSGARDGIDARLYWPGLGDVPAAELVLRRLLPLAHEGLARSDVAPADADRLLAIIERRCVALRNGASWQSEVFHHLHDDRQLDRGAALREMTRRYRDYMHSNEPVHDWPIR